MGIIKEEQILAVTIDEDLVCKDCVTTEELDKTIEDDYFTEDEAERTDDFYFCDRCKKKIHG